MGRCLSDEECEVVWDDANVAGGAAAPFTVLKTMLPMMRHGSVWVHDGIAIVAYSLAGDHPERLLVPCCADVNRC